MDKDKLRSFIRLCKRDCVAVVCLAEDFEDFMASPFTDAYEYFCSKGMIQTETISNNKIIKWVNEAWEEKPNICIQDLIKVAMVKSGGKLDPNKVKEIVMDYLES